MFFERRKRRKGERAKRVDQARRGKPDTQGTSAEGKRLKIPFPPIVAVLFLILGIVVVVNSDQEAQPFDLSQILSTVTPTAEAYTGADIEIDCSGIGNCNGNLAVVVNSSDVAIKQNIGEGNEPVEQTASFCPNIDADENGVVSVGDQVLVPRDTEFLVPRAQDGNGNETWAKFTVPESCCNVSAVSDMLDSTVFAALRSGIYLQCEQMGGINTGWLNSAAFLDLFK